MQQRWAQTRAVRRICTPAWTYQFGANIYNVPGELHQVGGGTLLQGNFLGITFSQVNYPPVTSPDISIAKTGVPTALVPGNPITYTLTVRNIGAGRATGVVVTDTLPVNTTFVSAVSEPRGQYLSRAERRHVELHAGKRCHRRADCAHRQRYAETRIRLAVFRTTQEFDSMRPT